jgi:hypothetical protein
MRRKPTDVLEPTDTIEPTDALEPTEAIEPTKTAEIGPTKMQRVGKVWIFSSRASPRFTGAPTTRLG